MKKNDNLKKEVIDGVTVIYTGQEHFVYQGHDHAYIFDNVDDFVSVDKDSSDFLDAVKNAGFMIEEDVEMFDNNGNKLYTTCNSIESASDMIIKLAEKGITAVIGPKGPLRGRDGRMVPNESKSSVGVYIVSLPDKCIDDIHKSM